METANKQLAAILRDVVEILALGTKGYALGDTSLDIVLGQIIASAPTWLTIVHLENLENLLILLWSLFLESEDKIILSRRNIIRALRNIVCKQGASTCLRINLIE